MRFAYRWGALFLCAGLCGGLAGVLLAGTASACPVLELDFEPSAGPAPYPNSDLQIAVWIEDAKGNFVDTVYITKSVGFYGIGNRPGEWNFPSEALYPYGRRETVLPVWAHRRGKTYPLLVFQDGYDQDLSHSISESSIEPYFCRPRLPSEVVDSIACASKNVWTDKGQFDPTGRKSLYPPRGDLTALSAGDSPDVNMYGKLDDLAGISRATPQGGVAVPTIRYMIPPAMPDGQYVAYIEVAKEGDFNAFYHVPKPADIAYAEYGVDYIGQPSVVWKVPFTLSSTTESVQVADDYAGYGDPLAGESGTLHPPDGTITTGVDGSGEGRLLEQEDPKTGRFWRFEVSVIDEASGVAPDPITGAHAADVTGGSVAIDFTAPTVGGTPGPAISYDVRFEAGKHSIDPNDLAAFEMLPTVDRVPMPAPGGTPQSIEIDNLSYSSHYSVGIRALGNCPDTASPIAVVDFTTPAPSYGAVSPCFLATAAYGSPLAPEVEVLRRFRDRFLMPRRAGRVFVATYYAFSPPFAAIERALPPVRAVVQAELRPLGTFAAAAIGERGR